MDIYTGDGYNDTGCPIPIEPEREPWSELTFSRNQKVKGKSASDWLKNLGVIDPDSEEGLYCIALIIRGGFYDEKE